MTTTPATAATRPDVSALLESDPETVAHILCAEFGGATWDRTPPRGVLDPGVWMLGPDMLHLFPNGDYRTYLALPRPLHDDGDAWRLEHRERLTLMPYAGSLWVGIDTAASWPDGTAAVGIHGWRTEPMKDRKRAAVVAALHKHAHDPRWSSLIPSVIERLEQALGA